jgi:serine/threonine-protein kinase
MERFLNGQLDAEDERQIEIHLEACSDCRARLQVVAAEERYYSEAPIYLSDDAFDGDFATGSFADRSSTLAVDDRPELLRIAEYLDPTDDPRMMGRFGGYEIAGIVGSGGMGIVLKGFEIALDRYVAIKVLAPHLATSGGARTRFAREARAAAAVLHENIVSIHRVAEANGLPFLVMPYIPGDSLVKRIDERGPLELREILRIGMQIAAGLAAAHSQGLVHRDIKPANILLGSGIERVTITDFGLARAADDASLTRSGLITGTPQFMSPEQARGEPVDIRSDLFSLGSVFYAMCTGRPPFRADTVYGVMRRISDSAPRPIRELMPEIPEWLTEVIEKLHAKNVEDRFQSATDVSELLGRWLSHIEQPATNPAPARLGRVAAGARGWRPVYAVASAVVTLALVAALVLMFFTDRMARNAREEDRAHKRAAQYEEAWRASVEAGPSGLTQSSDEQSLYESYEQVRERVLDFERDWSMSPAPPNSLEQELPELHKQLDRLSKQIDQSGS